MSIREIQAKSILRKQKKIDSWFVSCYGMNLYRGCLHNCTYCDGRSEKYNVDGEFGHDVAVKINAIDILKRELNPQKKRVPFKRCFFTVGGGVCDAYQKPEKKYQLTRQALELLAAYGYPVAILTKSTLVKRDINLLKQINQKSRAVLCFSISSTDEHLSSIFEPGVPSPGQRLQAISLFKDNGIACGVYLLPVIPYITDTEEIIEQSVAHSCAAGADYIIFGGMTLKQGRQKEHFYKILKTFNPDLIKKYDAIYKDQKWGQATNE